MRSERSSAASWQCYKRSHGGMWVRATRTEESILLEWQIRTVHDAGRVRTLDANGDVVSDVRTPHARWGTTWHLAGSVPLDDAFVEWSGVPLFDACAAGAMQHMAAALAAGYGETPEEIVSWFSDMASGDWLIEGAQYRIVRDVPPVEGLVGSVGTLALDADGNPILTLHVGERAYPVGLEDPATLRAFLCSSEIIAE